MKILLTSHSAGTGLAVFALEKLPPEVRVDTVLLISPALSPGYDLSKALAHVTNKAYAFTSPNDFFVLGVGTSVFGTIDGKKCESAGRIGFVRPEGADAAQYKKLVAEPYQKAWMKYGNIGDHVTSMARAFSAAVYAPILTADLPRKPASAAAPAATQPAGRAS